MIKFIHTGDIHLGLQFKSVSFRGEKAQNRRRELWSTFERIVDYGKEQKVEFLFIAGDLFEEAYFTLGDMRRVRDILAQAKDINIIISAGNHDFKDRTSLYNKIDWTENVFIFQGEGIQKKKFPDLNTTIYGYSWDRLEIKDNILFKDFQVEDTNMNNILVIHGDIGTNSSYLPLNIRELKDLNMDYIALGHIHKPEIIEKNIAYCGCPEPLDFGEIGPRGFIQGSIENKELNIEFLPFSKRQFLFKEIALDPDMGYGEILEKVTNISLGDKNKDFYRINLIGLINKDIDMESLYKDVEEGFYHIELIDKTTLDYDLESLKRDNRDNIIGQFISQMEGEDLEDPIIKDALYLGLEALLKGRI